MALVIMCQQAGVCATPGLKKDMEQAQNEAGKQTTLLDVETVVRKANDAAATLRLPENAHTKEGQEKAQKAKELFDSPVFQAQLQCQQTLIKEDLEDKKGKDTIKEPGKLSPSESVYLFLSSAMPEKNIHALLDAVARAGKERIIPVMQGFPLGLAEKAGNGHYFSRVLQERPDCQTRPDNRCPWLPVAIRINPALFARYDITEVPALVYDNGQEVWSIHGDADLAFLLEKVNKAANSPALADISTRLRGGQ